MRTRRSGNGQGVVESTETNRLVRRLAEGKKVAKPQHTTIYVPEIQMETTIVEIDGLTPLIINPFTESALTKMEKKQQGKEEAKEVRDPAAEIKEKLDMRRISGVKGAQYSHPAKAILDAMAVVAGREKILSKARVYSLITVTSESGDAEIPIYSPHPPEVRTGHGKPQWKGPMLIFYHPKFFPWSMKIKLTYVASTITKEAVINLLHLAGATVGIGNARKEKGLGYGTFEIR